MPDSGEAPAYGLGRITFEYVWKLWPQIEELLKPLLEEEGLYHPVDILGNFIKGDMVIWVACEMGANSIDAVMVTSICRYPRRTMCAVPYIAGKNMRKWKDRFMREVEDYARANGCTYMTGGYRRGWVRAAGYEEWGVMLRKRLEPLNG